MTPCDLILDDIRRLREADNQLQPLMRNLKAAFFEFRHRRSQGWCGQLILRHALDPEGRIRRLFWARSLRTVKKLGARSVRLSIRLRGRFRSSWIYHFARDWRRKGEYLSFARQVESLNRRRSTIVKTFRDISFALRYRWASKADPADRLRAQSMTQQLFPDLPSGIQSAIIGVVAFDHAIADIETQLGFLVEDYRRAFDEHLEVTFEPILRRNANGTFRLTWGFAQRVGTSKGRRLYTHHIAGWPTDRWMRGLKVRTRTRREVGAFTKRMRATYAQYREITSMLGRWHQRASCAVARAGELLPAQAGAATGTNDAVTLR